MKIACRFVVILIPLVFFICPVAADEPVAGMPQMLVGAYIAEETLNGKRFVATTMDWMQSRQSWREPAVEGRGGRSSYASIKRSRLVLALRADRFDVPLDMLKFSRLNGDAIDISDVNGLLDKKRAVVFLPKGTAVHPVIANSLHPETLVATRVTYPVDPLVIGIPEKR